MKRLTCPKCGKHKIQHVMFGGICTADMHISKDGVIIKGNMVNENYDTDFYQCEECCFQNNELDIFIEVLL